MFRCSSKAHQWATERDASRCCTENWARITFDPEHPPKGLDPEGQELSSAPPLMNGWVLYAPEYLTACTGASAARRALFAAENACRVPLNERGRFRMMDFTKEAMEALDQVRYDDITTDMVRARIGKAQARFEY